jgi:predicted RNA binding protein YcfA (HicA-like mRNA interferase family)
MRSREVIAMIEADGWYFVRQTGSHRHYRHPTKPGTATVPDPKADLPRGTLRSISKQTGVPLP